MYVTFANSRASRFASSRRRARHPPDRSIGRDEKAAKTEERSNGGLNDVESSTRSSKKSVARSSSSSRRVFHAMPAPWIEHGILSLRRRAPMECRALDGPKRGTHSRVRGWVQDSRVTTAPYRLASIVIVTIDGSALGRGGLTGPSASSTGLGDCYGSEWRV